MMMLPDFAPADISNRAIATFAAPAPNIGSVLYRLAGLSYPGCILDCEVVERTNRTFGDNLDLLPVERMVFQRELRWQEGFPQRLIV